MIRLLLLCLMLAAGQVRAQSLVADAVGFDGRTVTAEGNVEVFEAGVRLTASAIRYDGTTGRLSIEGPLSVTDADGTLILASEAELSSDLREGVLRQARLVLDRQVQLSADVMVRTEGRYTALANTVASSCRVCETGETPIWEIRASRVIHDQVEHQVWFRNATFRLLGVPILWAPALRLPDPTLKRSDGFLIPSARVSSRLGTGFRLPYFLTLGDHADLTVTPFLATETRTVEGRYRQAFRRGTLEVTGAVSKDDFGEDAVRGYVFGRLDYDLPQGFRLNVDVETASDASYLSDYGYTDADRLTTSAAITRTRDRDLLRARIFDFTTLRGDEVAVENTLPDTVTELVYARRLATDLLGGDLWATFDATTVARDSSAPGVGRDVARTGVDLSWDRTAVIGPGIEAEARLATAVDLYELTQDPDFGSGTTRVVPQAGLTLRWPLLKTEPRGGTQLLTPIAHLAWSDATGDPVPNEDSRVVEFDEGNLTALSRFPGGDRIEVGTRAALGAEWRRTGDSGWQTEFTVGRVFRADNGQQFAPGTGLNGPRSNWLIAGGLERERLRLDARVLTDDRLDVTEAETRIGLEVARGGLAATWVKAVAEPAESRPDPLSELRLAADWALTDAWSGRFEGQYDFLADRATRAGLGIEYRNECIAVTLSLSRRFTSSTNVTPITDASLGVSLGGFGGRRTSTGPARCG